MKNDDPGWFNDFADMFAAATLGGVVDKAFNGMTNENTIATGVLVLMLVILVAINRSRH